jgi:hypothetical protein
LQESVVLLKSQKDFFAGLLFTVVGGAFAWGSTAYTVGDAARMGPGYFPLMLGIILTVMGMVISGLALVRGAPGGDRIGAWAFRPLLLVLGANVAFGALLVGVPALGLPGFGLVVAIFALTFIASLAADEFVFKEVLVLAAVLAAGSWLAFVEVLGLQFPVWPSFITG